MMNLVVLVSIFVCAILAGDPVTIDEYLNVINSFIANTTTYTYPVDSSSFLKGKQDTTLDCDLQGEYDFIIVGAGSAGSVLARRLSEHAHTTILLIEAGGAENRVSDIPGYFHYLPMSDLNWGYKSVPQTNSLLGFVDNVEYVPRGKVLGGSSVLNAMLYVRGNADDYNRWAAEGNPGWAYKDVLPYFIKSERANLAHIDPGYHGFEGPLSVQRVTELSPLGQAFIDAHNELGRPALDYNGERQAGVARAQVTATNGQRVSANRAFLQPAKGRQNLSILTRALVTELLFRDNAARGVRYLHGGQCYRALAHKELILSAGAINTPQLLMLAGIGPADHLTDKHIGIRRNLPGVGQNLWDHLVLNQIPFALNYSERVYTQQEQLEMYLNGSGPLTVAGGAQALAFVHLSSNRSSPDVEHIFTTGVTPNTGYSFHRKLFNMKAATYNAVVEPLVGRTTATSFAVLLHPKSRGSVRLQSKDPLAFPLTDPNYLSDAHRTDVQVFVAALKHMLKLADTAALRKFGARAVRIRLAACPAAFGTDAYFECLIRHLANTIHHWSGTCRMGPRTDGRAVVDERLLVHGLAGLRVVDCSVIPVTIAGHTNAAAYMIAEKAADMIKEDHGLL